MSWEPHNRSSQSTNRWKPPSPVPSGPPMPLPTITRETWRPESSWAPKGRPAQEPPTPIAEQNNVNRPINETEHKPHVPPTSPRRRERMQYEDTAMDRLDRRNGPAPGGGGGGWQRDRFGKGGIRDNEDRSWGAWNSKIDQVKRADDRRAGPSRPADVPTHFDRRREMQDEAQGRSWSAWKSKVEGTGPAVDDRRREPEPARGRERDEGWGARRKIPDEPRFPLSDRRDGDGDRNWATYKDKRDIRPRDDERPPPPSRPSPPRRPRDSSRSTSPASPGRRSPIESRKPAHLPNSAARRSPRRSIGRRDSPDYSPVARPRAPLPTDTRAQVRNRGSPDYGIGRGDRGKGTDDDTPGRGRSPDSSRKLHMISPRSRRQSQSASRSPSAPRRPRSPPGDARPVPTRRSPSPEFRPKRPRRQSPEYNPRRSPSPPPSRQVGKAPLPPQAAVFSNGAAPPRGPSLASQFARMDNNESQTYRRNFDRPPPMAPHIMREMAESGGQRPYSEGRPDPDYDRGAFGGPGPSRPGYRPPPSGRPDFRPQESAGLPYSSDSNPSDSAPTRLRFTGNRASPPRTTQVPPVASIHNANGSPVKIALLPSVAKTGSVAQKPGLRQFFEAASPSQDSPSNSQPNITSPPPDSDADMDIDPETPVTTIEPMSSIEAPAESREDSERKYNEYLDTVAPYLRSAFKEWLSQATSVPLSAFLIHYFGRQPDDREMESIEQLMRLREPLLEDQDESSAPSVSHTNGVSDDAMRLKAATTIVTSQATPVSSDSNGHREGETSANKTLLGETYERLACVGEGTYGKVYKARRVEDGTYVALKRIRMEGEKDGFPVTAMREIKLLQSIKHDNIIRLYEMMVSKGSVYMVFDYMEHDLTGVLSQPSISFSPANLKSLNHQMIAGLEYLHRRSILHRDMKGSNILLTAEGDLKLADFGLARLYNRKRKADYTNRVITLWYRSPELLMGETMYGPEVDMWSAGCIMLEMYFTKPILQGNDEIHQLEVINSIMGTPREDDWPQVRDLPWYELVKPKVELRSKFRESFSKRLSSAAMDVAEGLLAMNPAKRLSATKALQMPYFNTEEPKMEKPTQLRGIGEHHEMSAKQERQRRKAESR